MKVVEAAVDKPVMVTAIEKEQLGDPAIAMAAVAEDVVSSLVEELTLEDPAVTMAAIAKEEEPALVDSLLNERELETREVEALLTAPVAAIEKKTSNSAVEVAVPEVPEIVAPKPPEEDIPMQTLMKAAEAAAVVEQEQENAVVAELSLEQEKPKVVNVVQKKKAAPVKKKAKVEPNRPAASPLARLLAEELKLDLNVLGKGTGKNGKILIDDVRKFQAQLESAKESMASNAGMAYFATARA